MQVLALPGLMYSVKNSKTVFERVITKGIIFTGAFPRALPYSSTTAPGDCGLGDSLQAADCSVVGKLSTHVHSPV